MSTLDVIPPFKAVLSFANEIWLELSDAELSDEVVDSEEIKLELVDEGSLKVEAQKIALLCHPSEFTTECDHYQPPHFSS